MSLVALAARIVTVKLLTGATLAAGRVYDSALDAIDQRIAAEKVPVLIVFTDDDTRTVEGRDLTNASRQLELVIEAAVASKVTIELPVEGGETEEVETVEIPHTDAGLEIILDMMGRQIMRAFMVDQGPWARLWRRIVLQPGKITVKRGAGSDKGVRFAARQMVITTETLSEPAFGREAEPGFWQDFLAALEGDADQALQPLAAAIRMEIEQPTLVGWRQAMADLGTNAETAGIIGLGPVPTPVAAEPPAAPYPQPDEPLVPVVGFDVGVEGDDEWTLDADAADDALGPEENA